MSLQALSRTLTSFPVKSMVKIQLFSSSIRHIRGRGGSFRRSQNKSQATEEFKDFLDSDDYDLDDAVGRSDEKQWEEFITNLDFRDPDVLQDLERVDRMERKKLKHQIIKKKYFKRDHEDNVLTWQAKEQMRYLNQEFPDEWTVDKLAESFPVSREGVLAVLKSKYIPVDHQEIRKHDNKALRNINNIKEKLVKAAMDTDEREALENKIQKVGNAAGMKNLPLTQLVTRQTIARQSKLLRPDNKIGPFKSMLMYYDRVAEGDKQIQHYKYELLPENSQHTENMIDRKVIEQTLDSVKLPTNETKNKRLDQTSKQYDDHTRYHTQEQYGDHTRYHTQEQYGDHTRYQTQKQYGDHTRYQTQEQYGDHTRYQTQEQFGDHTRYQTQEQFGVHSRSKGHFNVNIVKSSEKTSSQKYEINNMQEENLAGTEHLPKKIQKWNTQSEVRTKDTFGKIVIKEKHFKDLINDDRVDAQVTNKVMQDKQHKQSSFYQKGKCVYDDHGEFLYKIP